MRIRHADLIPFSKRWSEPVDTARHEWQARSGILLRLVDDAGHVGLGEAAPLPNYSRDGLDGCARALAALPWTDDYAFDPSASVAAQLSTWSRAIGASLPAARFALETALLDLTAQRAGRPLWSLLATTAEESTRAVPLSTLVAPFDTQRAAQLALAARDRGIRTFKVKVGRPALRATEVSLVERLRNALGANVALRLDANRSLAKENLAAELAAFAPYDPEFIEEPAPLDALLTLQSSPIAVAFDESLQTDGEFEAVQRLASLPWCVAVVLKPTALGGFSRCLEIAEWAKHAGLPVTVSHTFDGVVGHAGAAHLALAIADRTYASGLDRHGGLDAWPDALADLVGPSHLLPATRPGLGLDPVAIVANTP